MFARKENKLPFFSAQAVKCQGHVCPALHKFLNKSLLSCRTWSHHFPDATMDVRMNPTTTECSPSREALRSWWPSVTMLLHVFQSLWTRSVQQPFRVLAFGVTCRGRYAGVYDAVHAWLQFSLRPSCSRSTASRAKASSSGPAQSVHSVAVMW